MTNILILIFLSQYLVSSIGFHLKISSLIGNLGVISKKQTLQTLKLYNEADNVEIWKDTVQYVDLSSVDNSESTTARSLPLFLLSGAFYPQGITYLHIYEMKYRTMMFDITQKDNLFGYIHNDPTTGQIAQIGTLCKITETELLEDGRQFISLEGIGRFKVRKILKTLPYIVGDVELNIEDEIPKNLDELKTIELLELSVYDSLKYYLRLMKEHGPNNFLKITQMTKKYRPIRNNSDNLSDHNRRTKFSFSLANMIQMYQDRESQLLLQTKSIKKRLEAQKNILMQASDLISEKLIAMNTLTAARRDEIKTITFANDNDEDILPPDDDDQVIETEKDEWDISNVM